MKNIQIIVSVNCIVNVFLNCINPDEMSIMWLVSMLVSHCQLQSVLSYCYLISSLESHCILCPVSLSLPLHTPISFPLLSTAAVSLLRWHRNESCSIKLDDAGLSAQVQYSSALSPSNSCMLLLYHHWYTVRALCCWCSLCCVCGLEESMMSSILCFYQELRHFALAACFYSGLWSEIRSYRTDEVSCNFLKSCGAPRELVFIIIKICHN